MVGVPTSRASSDPVINRVIDVLEKQAEEGRARKDRLFNEKPRRPVTLPKFSWGDDK